MIFVWDLTYKMSLDAMSVQGANTSPFGISAVFVWGRLFGTGRIDSKAFGRILFALFRRKRNNYIPCDLVFCQVLHVASANEELLR